jgi:hypothetical protein
VIYLFLPITRKDVTVMFGTAASLTCIALFLGKELICVRNFFFLPLKSFIQLFFLVRHLRDWEERGPML